MVKLTPKQRVLYGRMCRNARAKMKVSMGAIASKLGQPVSMILEIETGNPVAWPKSRYERLEKVLGITSSPETFPPSLELSSSPESQEASA